MISAYLLGRHHNKPNEEIRQQVIAAMQYALGQQIREDSAWGVAERANAIGGLPGSPISRTVRIDYVQHVCSAMLRTAELLQ